MTEKQANIISKDINLINDGIIQRILWIVTFTLLTAIGANIEIPNQPVPFTLQTLFVLLAGGIIGRKDGTAGMGLYIILGMIGLPVFSGSAFGIARILGPTGGYILSFPIAAFIVGNLVMVRKEYWWIVISMIIGSFIILCIGTIQLNLFYIHNWAQSFKAGFFIFSWWDAVKIMAAASITYCYFRSIDSKRKS